MKKLFTLILLGFLFFCHAKLSAQAKYDKGNILINAGIGLGYYYGSGGVPILVSGEYAITDAISVGPYLGYTSRTYNDAYFGNKWRYRYTFVDFGVRGAYHFSKHLNLKTDKLDLYGGVFLGYLFANSKVLEAPSGYYAGYYNNYSYGSTVRLGLFGGARYYFTDKVAAFGELGYGIAPLSIGVTFKL